MASLSAWTTAPITSNINLPMLVPETIEEFPETTAEVVTSDSPYAQLSNALAIGNKRD